MKTLIELYDERPLENVLSTEVFRPERTVFICPRDIADDKRLKRKLREYMQHRGVEVELVFTRAGMYSAKDILERLQEVVERYEDCALDVSGGTDDALFAAGALSAKLQIPVFTYSRKKNAFFNIMNADFADEYVCNIDYSVEDSILMAGGALHMGRVDNSVLGSYMDRIDPFFNLYLKYRKEWTRDVEYIQQISHSDREQFTAPLDIHGAYYQKAVRGAPIPAPEKLLKEYERIGFISNLRIDCTEGVSFRFSDHWVRTWMRDIGSVLELYTYKECLKSGLFGDVVTSAVVDWEGDNEADAVTNEIDVMATCGVNQVFISCKTCDVKTEALNELAILRDRFGSGMSRAAIVTTKLGGSAMRRRAHELNIDVIDINDITSGRISGQIKKLAEQL